MVQLSIFVLALASGLWQSQSFVLRNGKSIRGPFPLCGEKRRPDTGKPKTTKKPKAARKQNWVERVAPAKFGAKPGIDPEEVSLYNAGVDGEYSEIGSLCKKLYDAMTSKNNPDAMSPEVKSGYRIYSMDFAAKEATRQALNQAGLQMTPEKEDIGLWGQVDSIQLRDPVTNKPNGPTHKTWESAQEEWIPGQNFDFVVRNVPASLRADALKDLLDPDGRILRMAQEQGVDNFADGIDWINILKKDASSRCESAPHGAVTEDDAFIGNEKRGYRVIHRSALLEMAKNKDGTENEKTLVHVMDALVSHGCLIVDVTDGGTNFEVANQLAKMWETVEGFFTGLDPDKEATLPPMVSVQDSPYAKVGYSAFDNGSKFLEMRCDRKSKALWPAESVDFLGQDGVDAIRESFESLVGVGKDVVRIALAASIRENAGLKRDVKLFSKAAGMIVKDLLDDGKASDKDVAWGNISMTPHRISQYAGKENPLEVFGAHTDTTFVTIVPAAATAGFEVYDEGAGKWYRPERRALAHWNEDQSSSEKESAEMGSWHARYVVIVPGELLQVLSGNEVEAAVHRVVASSKTRFSAPILLRGRPGSKVDFPQYLGTRKHKFPIKVDGMEMENVHNALQG